MSAYRTRPTPHVSIVGAGWAGLSCAISATLAGARVDVYEQRSVVKEPPLHVDVVPNMMRGLGSLGVAERCVRSGFPYRSVTVTDSSGDLCTESDCVRLADAHLPAAVGMTQQALTDALLDRAQDLGVSIHRETPVSAIEFDGPRAALRLPGASWIEPDIALLAGGALSNASAMPVDMLPGSDLTWWCGLVPRPSDLNQPTFVLASPRSKVLMVPVSGSAAGLALIDSNELARDETVLPAAHGRRWLLGHAGHPRQLARLADRLGDDTVFHALRVRPALRRGPWHRGNLLCVGDAAHALPQHFGQAPAQAIEDAVVFGDLLSRELDTPSLLEAFTQRRRPRVEAVFDVVMRAVQWGHAPDGSTGLKELTASLAEIIAAPP